MEMWRSRKFILVSLLVTLVLVGGTAGVVFAKAERGHASPVEVVFTDNATPPKTLSARVATILGIDPQKVESAFAQARREMQAEALDNYLKNLVARGKITQAQADQYKAWWQARPITAEEQFRQQLKVWQQARPGTPSELKTWQQARPDLPLGFGSRGHGGFRGMGGFRGCGPFIPPNK